MSAIDRAEIRLAIAAQRLAEARKAEAEAFLRYRIASAKTDNAARAMATIDTQAEVMEAEAEYEIAKAALAREGI